MAWIDTKTGKKYKTLKGAQRDILKAFRARVDYFECMGEIMVIPYEIFTWIAKNHWKDFKRDFAHDVYKAESLFINDYVSEWVEKS